MIKVKIPSKFFKKILKTTENHLGFIVLIFFVMIILYATWLFYNFVYKSVSYSPQSSFEKVEIKKSIFEIVTLRLEARKENILEAMEKSYKDIFK